MSTPNLGLPRYIVVLAGVLLAGLVLAGVGQALTALAGVLTPVFFALLIAYALDPVVDRIEGRRVPRGLAVGLVLTGIGLLVAAFLLVAVPLVARDLLGFIGELPQRVEQALVHVTPWLERYGVRVPHSLGEAISGIEGGLRPMAETALAPAGTVLQAVLGGTASVIGTLFRAILVVVLAAYLLYDFDRMTAAARELLPHRVRATVQIVATEIDQVMGQFVRGQVMLMALLAVIYWLTYAALGVRLSFVIGVTAGLLSFIPYIGSGSALVLGLLMSLLDFDGWGRPLGVIIAYTVIQLLEGYVLQPKVVGDKVGLSAVWIMVALMAGGELFGFLGVLLAVPVTAALKIIVVRLVTYYRTTYLFQRGAPSEAAGAIEPGDARGGE